MQRHILESFTKSMLFAVMLASSIISDASLQKVIACIGGDAVLPCEFAIPKGISEKDIRVYWQLDAKVVLYAYDSGHDDYENRDIKYRSRTYLNTTQLLKGKCPLTLFNVTLNDKRVYACIIQIRTNSGFQFFSQSDVELLPTANYSVPTITMEKEGNPMNLTCSSDGGYPEPSVQWINLTGHVFKDSRTLSTVNNQSGLYSVTSTLEVAESHGKIFCVVSNPELQSSVHSEGFPLGTNASPSREPLVEFKRQHKGLTWGLLFFVVAFVILCAYILFVRRKHSSMTCCNNMDSISV